MRPFAEELDTMDMNPFIEMVMARLQTLELGEILRTEAMQLLDDCLLPSVMALDRRNGIPPDAGTLLVFLTEYFQRKTDEELRRIIAMQRGEISEERMLLGAFKKLRPSSAEYKELLEVVRRIERLRAEHEQEESDSESDE